MLETRTLSSAVPILSVSLKSGFNPPSYITPEKNQPAPPKATKIKIINTYLKLSQPNEITIIEEIKN